MYPYHIFSGESEDDCKGPRELWFGQGSVIRSQKCIHITFFLVKVTMTVKTAPENSGLVRVQVSNLKNIYQYHNILSGESDDDCKDCPRELWFGQGSVIKSQKQINITIFFLVKVTMTAKTAPENSGLVKVQFSKKHKYNNITKLFLVKATLTAKTAPENSGLVKVQLSNLKNTSISQKLFQVKVTMTLKTAPDNSGLVKVQ